MNESPCLVLPASVLRQLSEAARQEIIGLLFGTTGTASPLGEADLPQEFTADPELERRAREHAESVKEYVFDVDLPVIEQFMATANERVKAVLRTIVEIGGRAPRRTLVELVGGENHFSGVRSATCTRMRSLLGTLNGHLIYREFMPDPRAVEYWSVRPRTLTALRQHFGLEPGPSTSTDHQGR